MGEAGTMKVRTKHIRRKFEGHASRPHVYCGADVAREATLYPGIDRAGVLGVCQACLKVMTVEYRLRGGWPMYTEPVKCRKLREEDRVEEGW